MNLSNLEYSIRLRIGRERGFFGPGVRMLLRLVERHGSILNASERMGMSYSKAWRIIKNAEKELDLIFLDRHVGGKEGGSSSLTAEGQDFLSRYEDFEKELDESARLLFGKYFGT